MMIALHAINAEAESVVTRLRLLTNNASDRAMAKRHLSPKQEKWKPIRGYEGLYDASNFGRIKRRSRRAPWTSPKGDTFFKILPDLILAAQSDKDGYLYITLWKNSKMRTHRVHRVVAFLFVPNPEKKPQVNHKNGKKDDNHHSNLEWATEKENVRHSFEQLGRTGVNPKRVRGVRGKTVLRFSSTADAGRNGFSQSLVARCARGQSTHHKGFVWRYE